MTAVISKGVRRAGLIGFALAATVAPVLAQPIATPHAYIGGNIGRTSTDDFNSSYITAPAIAANSDDKDNGYKLYGGYQFNRNFAVEAGFHDLGRYDYGYRSATGTFGGNTRFQGGHLDLVAGWPVMDRLTVFGRLGANWTRARTNVATTGLISAAGGSRSGSNWGPKYGLGVEYAVTSALAVRAEWERYRVRDELRGRGNIDMASIGLVYRFGAPAAAAPSRVIYTPPPAAPAPAPAPVVVTPPPPPPAPMPAPAPAPRPYRN